MDQQLRQWKRGVDRFWSATAPDYLDAARLAAEIAQDSDDANLRQAAAQALPSLRRVARRISSEGSKDRARRRLGVVRNILHAAATPQFGNRRSAPKSLTPEERNRQLLGLPPGGHFASAEIHQAYKRAAKTAHPDCGGNARAFIALCEARDALMMERVRGHTAM